MSDLDPSELIDNSQNNAVENFSQRMVNTKLMALRAQMPFVPILPFPDSVLTFIMVANVAQDINLPDGTKMAAFSGNGEYYISKKGNAQIPDGTANTNQSGSMMNPEQSFYYVEEIRQLSVVAPFACKVTVQCFQQL